MAGQPQVRSPRVAVSTVSNVALAVDRCHAVLADGRAAAADALDACRALADHDLPAFFDFLASLSRTDSAAGSPCRELLHRLNLAPGGTPALIDMRRFLLTGLDLHPSWAVVEAALAGLLRATFSEASLDLRRIDWDTSSTVLGFLITHDRVKPMHGWRDLHRRLRRDRRCFGLFHPALPDEPVAFAEIALTSGLPADVQALVDPDAPVLSPGPRPSVVFYSISSCHEGLRGVRFGNALIRRAIDDLAREFPRTRTVATLSPVPGFRDWLTRIAGDGHGQSGVAPLLAELDDACWRDDPARSAALGRVLVPLCAFYLLRVKRGVEPADPVARFHLGNGARLERINWPGDQSDIGMRGSAGLTVNYVYRLAEIERNHQACATGGEVLASTRIHSLARQAAAGS